MSNNRILSTVIGGVQIQLGPDISNLATNSSLGEVEEVLSGAINALDKKIDNTSTNLEAYVNTEIYTLNGAIDASFGDVYTKSEADGKFLTEHQSLEEYAKTADVNSSLGNYFTKDEVNSSLGNYYTKSEADGKFLTEHQSLEDYAKIADVDASLAKYYTKDEIDGKEFLVAADIEGKAEKTDVERLDSSVSAIETTLDTLLDSSNANGVIDTFKEVEDFLNEVSDASTLTGMLKDAKDAAVAEAHSNMDASLADYFTNAQADASFGNVYTKDEVYNKTEIDASFGNVYVKDEVYTKSEIDASVAAAIADFQSKITVVSSVEEATDNTRIYFVLS